MAMAPADSFMDLGNLGGPRQSYGDLFGPLSEETSQRLAQAFSVSRNADGFVVPEAGKRQLERTGLGNEMLKNIWHLSDLDRDGRLTLREFVCAMHLAEMASKGHRLPVDVKPEQQATLARDVERVVYSMSRFGDLSYEESQRLARLFESSRDPQGFVPADPGKRLLERSGISKELLQSVWQLSDLDRDGRLSLREFVCAMHLVEHARQGQPLPMEVRSEQQVLMARSVERFVNFNSSPGKPTKPQPEEFSTADTAPSPKLGLDFDGMPGNEFSWHGRWGHAADEDVGLDGLGQLALVLNATAKAAPGDFHRLGGEVLAERDALERLLERQRVFAEEVACVRESLEQLHDAERQDLTEARARQRRIEHLKEEVEFVETEASGHEGDIGILREVSGVREGFAEYVSREKAARIKSEEERAQLEKDKKTVGEMLVKIGLLIRDKRQAQEDQQHMLEKQRHIEQDRDLMQKAIEAERDKLNSMREQRLKLWEERTSLERELTEIAKEQPEAVAALEVGAVRDNKGCRN